MVIGGLMNQDIASILRGEPAVHECSNGTKLLLTRPTLADLAALRERSEKEPKDVRAWLIARHVRDVPGLNEDLIYHGATWSDDLDSLARRIEELYLEGNSRAPLDN